MSLFFFYFISIKVNLSIKKGKGFEKLWNKKLVSYKIKYNLYHNQHSLFNKIIGIIERIIKMLRDYEIYLLFILNINWKNYCFFPSIWYLILAKNIRDNIFIRFQNNVFLSENCFVYYFLGTCFTCDIFSLIVYLLARLASKLQTTGRNSTK